MLVLVYLAHVAVVVLGAASIVWLVSLVVRDTSIVDVFWGFGFALVGATGLWMAWPPTAYQWLLGLLPILWGMRLTLYLARRNLRLLGGHGEDGRYVAMRKRSGLSEMAWRLRAGLTVYAGQALLILIVAAPVWVAFATGKQTSIGLLSVLGLLLWGVGVMFEAVGDAQLTRFKRAQAGYDGPYEDKPVLDTGLWAWTRHPNYFGNAVLWWGIWLVACEAPWGWAGVAGPIVMTALLTRVSGRDLLERRLMKRPAYRDYAARVPSFIPRPPRRG